jgi:hypothetical protein
MARRAVLKTFSELKPVEQDRIALVASGISAIVFKGEAIESFKPREGSQINRVWRMLKLDERQQIAWVQFADDVALAYGKSGAVCAAYGEQVAQGDGSELKIPRAKTNVYYRRIERLLTEYLTREERALLYELLQDALKANSSLSLETIGVLRSGFSDKTSTRVAGVVHVQTLLSRLAAFYQV